ncbi:hypothetical protein PCC9214_00954 [Planktothrix tepida]|uniref:DUF3037 domain-containing protein n=2 Tax=Planktothrix TaxID=54304 RepID=A0A1J1LGC6_9CYAN|nr:MULTISPECIES: DUF3037 domain-containing protein [Planktothrix]CAD5925715.1 hypothetical protein PCC9214_00954 [Planktothrix tepida]CAD5981424.1 hypothetical protein NO713_04817 [Planktothrix pseudagardhii]CUR31246.1 conserved hypothetical protein [Planktothrix tepida PCC 9214]
MVSRYSIIQYVPNPIANERINIGVVAFSDQEVRVQFLSNWERVRNFGMENIDFLTNFAARMKETASRGLMFPGDEESEIPKHERLTEIVRGWRNSIQFTEPHPSLADVDKLLHDIVEDFLVDPHNSLINRDKSYKDIAINSSIPSLYKSKLRDRQQAARVATSSVKEAFKNWLGQENQEQFKTLIKQKYELYGKREKFKFDVAVANGNPYLLAQGLSFEINPPENSLQALSWSIENVKKCNQDLPIAVITLPPKEDSPDYLERQNIYEQSTANYLDLGADVLQEDQVPDWIEQKLNPIKQKILESVHQT